MHLPKVVFLKINSIQEKIQRICTVIEEHFYRGETILVTAPGAEAAAYLDSLFWRMPEEGFIPHAIVHAPSREPIAITTEATNFNNAKNLFNLCVDISPLWMQFSCIYELQDGTQGDKLRFSQQRMQKYKAFGIEINEI
jgi:DNA polymerase-3 subunit chi